MMHKHKLIEEELKNCEHPILDVGSGHHPFGDVNVDVIYYDSDNIVCDLQREDLPGYNEGHFKTVICSDTLEHIIDYTMAIRRIHKLLAKDGKFIVTIPNSGNLLFKLKIWNQDVKTGEEHLNFWNKKDFITILGFFGFKMVKYKKSYYYRGKWYSKIDPFCLFFVFEKSEKFKKV